MAKKDGKPGPAARLARQIKADRAAGTSTREQCKPALDAQPRPSQSRTA